MDSLSNDAAGATAGGTTTPTPDEEKQHARPIDGDIDEVAVVVEEEEEEEFWPTIQSGQSLQVRREIQEVHLTRDFQLSLWMLKEKDLTPLDMTYGNDDDDNNDANDDDNDSYYDGTGGMLWMAANCWCLMVSLQVPSLMRYLRPSSSSSSNCRHRVCELGCGTGAAGIALLKFCGRRRKKKTCSEQDTNAKDTDTSLNNDRRSSCYDDHIYHVVFTDSDEESLDWCQKNCELNGIDPSTYRQNVLSWGRREQQPENEPAVRNVDANDDNTHKNENTNDDDDDDDEKESLILIPHSFDTIIATDVIYDLTMILPLLQTAEHLLVTKQCKHKQDDSSDGDNLSSEDNNDHHGNYVILTHVPRFCLPRQVDVGDEEEEDEKTTPLPPSTTSDRDRNNRNDNKETNYLELEQHIVKQATTVGFTLKDMLRVDETLKDYYSDSANHTTTISSTTTTSPTDQQLSLEKIHDSHAVILVFERS